MNSLFLLAFLALAVLRPAPASCFEPGLSFGGGDFLFQTQPTHPRMSRNAARAVEHTYTQEELDHFAAGSADEDRFWLIAPVSGTRTWHGFNPVTGEGFWGSDTETGPAGAGLLYREALEARARLGAAGGTDNEAQDESALHLLGRVAHLIQDMTSVAHVHLDNHGLDPDHFPFFFELDDFEAYAAWAYSSDELVPPGEAVIPDWSGPVEELVAELAGLTYRVSAWSGRLRPRAWDPVEGRLGEMFPELTYVESGFWGDGVYRIGGVGDYDPEESLIEANAWYPTPETAVLERRPDGRAGEVAGEFYIQYAQTAVPEYYRTREGTWRRNTDRAPLVELWGRELFPLAVGYTAALLMKFQEEAGILQPPPAGE